MLDEILSALRAYRFRYSDEEELQRGVSRVFDEHGLPYLREVILSPKDRVDFMVGDIAVEIKVDGTLSQVTRQLHRYAQIEEVSSVVLLTTRSKHRNMPETMNGKLVHVVWVSSL